jgi:superoxide dismutase
VTSAVANFGSGWTWLVKKADGSVDIVNTGAAGTPLTRRVIYGPHPGKFSTGCNSLDHDFR